MVYSSVWPKSVTPTPEAPLSLILLLRKGFHNSNPWFPLPRKHIMLCYSPFSLLSPCLQQRSLPPYIRCRRYNRCVQTVRLLEVRLNRFLDDRVNMSASWLGISKTDVEHISSPMAWPDDQSLGRGSLCISLLIKAYMSQTVTRGVIS